MVVGLCASAGEDDFLSAGADQSGDLFASSFDGGASPLAGGVDGRRVAKFSREIGKHRVEDFRLDGSRGVVIEVDAVHRATHRILPADRSCVLGAATRSHPAGAGMSLRSAFEDGSNNRFWRFLVNNNTPLPPVFHKC